MKLVSWNSGRNSSRAPSQTPQQPQAVARLHDCGRGHEPHPHPRRADDPSPRGPHHEEPGAQQGQQRPPGPTDAHEDPGQRPEDEGQWGRRPPGWPPTVEVQHVDLADPIAVELPPQPTGRLPRPVARSDGRVDEDPPASLAPPVVEVGILGHSGWKGAESSQLQEVGPAEGAQVDRIGLPERVGMAKPGRAHRHRGRHGCRHCPPERSRALRPLGAPDGRCVRGEEGLDGSSDVVGRIGGVSVGPDQHLAVCRRGG